MKPPFKTPLRGTNHANWKGDAASPTTKRNRARRIYIQLGICENCHSRPAVDRHHKDTNTGNNQRENLMFLCRQCHMTLDGRLEKLIAHSLAKKGKKTYKPCAHCGKLSNPLRKGRCHACNEYYRRHGVERPLIADKFTWNSGEIVILTPPKKDVKHG